MIATMKPLLELTAAELMSREVTTIPQAMSLRAAARLLSEMQITGAPVVDEIGECVGVLSATDFMRHEGFAEEGGPRPCNPGCFHSAWQVVDVDALPGDEVGAYMTPGPVTVSPDVSIVELARNMIDAHIHRVVVVNTENRPVGIVSSTDILAAVAHAERHAL